MFDLPFRAGVRKKCLADGLVKLVFTIYTQHLRVYVTIRYKQVVGAVGFGGALLPVPHDINPCLRQIIVLLLAAAGAAPEL